MPVNWGRQTAGVLIEKFVAHKKIYVFSAAFFGFFSDFFGPVAPFAEYLFCLFTLILLGVIFISLFYGSMTERLKSTAVFSLLVCIMTGGFWGLQTVTGSDNGVMSEYLPAIEKLQISIGVLDQNVEQIKVDTARIKQDTSELKKNTRDISEKIDSLGESVGKQGGLIADPQTPEEWYSNARVYELKGDFGNARSAYAKYFTFDRQYLDPHQRYQTFLKVQEGLNGAREIYNGMFEGNRDPVIEYAKLLLNPSETKREKISEFLLGHPDFIPGYFELSRLYSKDVLGEQTLNDKKNEWRYLREFINLAERSNLSQYYIDQTEVSRTLETAQSRLAQYSPQDVQAFSNPLTVEPMSTSSGWMFNIYVADTALELFYRLEGNREFVSMGVRELVDPTTNLPYANNTLSIPELNREQRIEFKYRDKKGRLNGPYEYIFSPGKEMVKQQEELTKKLTSHWVVIKESTIYFSSLVMRRCGLREVKYGIDRADPDIVFELPPCHPDQPQTMPSDAKFFITIPEETQFVTVQLKYASGEISPVQQFPNPWGT